MEISSIHSLGRPECQVAKSEQDAVSIMRIEGKICCGPPYQSTLNTAQ